MTNTNLVSIYPTIISLQMSNKSPTNLTPFKFTAKIFNSNMYGADFKRTSSKEKFIELFHTRAKRIYQGAVKQESEKMRVMVRVGSVAATELKRKLVKPMLYDAMMVVIAERSPVEFLYGLRDDEQNGLRLSTQIKINILMNRARRINARDRYRLQTLQAQGRFTQNSAKDSDPRIEMIDKQQKMKYGMRQRMILRMYGRIAR